MVIKIEKTIIIQFLIALIVFMQPNLFASSILKYEITQRKGSQNSSIVPMTIKQQHVFVVTDSIGIGEATIALDSQDNKWPDRIKFRFKYDDKRKFKAMENFTLKTSHLIAKGGLTESGKIPYYVLENNEQDFNNQPNPTGFASILIKSDNNGIEVDVPTKLFSGLKEIDISWIDFYR